MQRQKKKLKKLPTLLLMAFSSCSTLPPRPEATVCLINALGQYRKCYDMSSDYDSQGKLLPSAIPSYKSTTTIEELDKFWVLDVDSFANLKAYLNQLRSR